MGSDPFSFISDTTKAENDKCNNLSKPSKPNKQENTERPKNENKLRLLRATFIIREDFLDKIKAIAYWERKQIKSVINEALSEFIEKKGNIKPVPQETDLI